MTKAATKTAAVAATKTVAATAKKDAAAPAAPAADKPTAGAVEDKPTAQTKAATSEALLVRTKKGVTRRCRSGFEFGPETKAVPLDDLTQEQLEAILNDPLLEVPQPDAATEEAAA